jgi:hypothetical protein
VSAVAVGELPDGTPVIVSGSSGSSDARVRVWRLADGALLGQPLWLTESVQDVAIDGTTVVTATGADIAVHQPAFLRPVR